MDPVLSLAFSMRATKGAYALLLGSGVSRAAGIPTGWDVLLDLIRKLAVVEVGDEPPDPIGWYRGRYGSEPDYSDILKALAPAPGDRQALLRDYFEPDHEEAEQGLKQPTAAHHAIAELMERGYVRVVITTNFDRLLESALQARGVAPTVIATPDQAQGALPLVHSPATIIKVHGDYLDTRIKNTPEELEQYDPRINQLLDQVFDEYGLVVCGWSAAWDEALRHAIERCSTRRFGMYFATRGEPEDLARALVERRGGIFIPTESADAFFQDLSEKVFALESTGRTHPATKQAAVAAVKRYLATPQNHIRLHDLVTEETERVHAACRTDEFDPGAPGSTDEFVRRLQRYRVLSEVLEALHAHGGFWGSVSEQSAWRGSVHRLTASELVGGKDAYIKLRNYPATRVFYASGIAALANSRFDNLSALLRMVVPNPATHERRIAAQALNPWMVIEHGVAKQIPGLEERKTPVSDHLFETLHQALEDLVRDEARYESAFNAFEYFLGLTSAYAARSAGWGYVGRIGWRWGPMSDMANQWHEYRKEAQDMGNNWPPVRAGLFSGDVENFLKIEEQYRGRVLRTSG